MNDKKGQTSRRIQQAYYLQVFENILLTTERKLTGH